jgi:hypothetical protein
MRRAPSRPGVTSTAKRHAACAEVLESRALLSIAPAGPDFRVNTAADGFETTAFQANAVAGDDAGNFVVAWGAHAKARLFDAQGAPRGDEFAVSDDTFNVVEYPAVDMAPGGGFVIAFRKSNPGGAGSSVYARRFDAAGVPEGADELVSNTFTRVGFPSVAVASDGGYVVAWSADSDVYARRFAADGSPRGGEFRVNTYVKDQQADPDVAAGPDGSFVVAWESFLHQDGSGVGVYAQRYDPDGSPAGGEFRVNETTLGDQANPSTTMDAAGRFVIAWGPGGMARRFGADGTPLGPEFSLGNGAGILTLAGDAAGNFIATWAGSRYPQVPAEDGLDVFARRFDSAGAPLGRAFRVNTTTAGPQDNPFVAMTSPERFVVVWGSGVINTPDSPQNPRGIFARRFSPSTPGPASVAGRHLFYNWSRFDPSGSILAMDDDNAIATDKTPLLPGQGAPSFANVSSYFWGLNGVMVDLAGLAIDADVSPADFDFGSAPLPESMTIREGAGVGGSDRVSIAWAPYTTLAGIPHTAIGNGWLHVTVKATDDTQLSRPDVFSFGSLVGETGDGGGRNPRVSAIDLAATKRNLNATASLTATTDFDRDGRVTAVDLSIVKRNLNAAIPVIFAPATATAPVPLALRRRAGDDLL